MQKVTRVVLADDHPRVREGVRFILSRAPDIEVVGEASNGVEALELVEQLHPDVMLLDVEMPVMDGNQVAANLQQSRSPTRVLVLSAYDDQHYIQELFAHGVAGYLIKDEVPQTVLKAVRGVARGEDGWVSEKVAEKLKKLEKRSRLQQTTLTERENQVLELVTSGKSDAEIGKLLGMSPQVVEKHMEELCQKLQVSSRQELKNWLDKQSI